jgi:hypothetical protein
VADSDVLQPNITSRMSSFIAVREKIKKKGEEESRFEFKPLPPSFISILGENINFNPNLKS